MEKFCKLHLRVLRPLVLLWPSRNFASDHLLKYFHLGQIWAALSQNPEVSHAKPGVRFKGDMAFQAGGGFGGLGG